MSNEMDDLIDTYRGIADRATPGPWFDHNTDDALCMNSFYVSTSMHEADVDKLPGKVPENVIAFTLLQHPRVVGNKANCWAEDARLIAVARNLIGPLLDVANAAAKVVDDEPLNPHMDPVISALGQLRRAMEENL